MEPLDWETYIALPPLPTCKSRQRKLLCFKQVQPYGPATALQAAPLYQLLCTYDLQLHQMTTEPSQPLRISRHIERDTFAHLQVMTAQTNVLATSEGHQRSVMAESDQPGILQNILWKAYQEQVPPAAY